MVHKDFRENRFKTRDEDYVGRPTDDPSEDLEDDVAEFSAANITAVAEMSIIVSVEGEVIVDGAYSFPLDNTWVNLLIWRPRNPGERLVGTYEGSVFHSWTGDESSAQDKFFVVRTDGVDRLIPAWSAVAKGFEKVKPNKRVLLLYAGLIPLKNGRTYHRILVGSAPDDGSGLI